MECSLEEKEGIPLRKRTGILLGDLGQDGGRREIRTRARRLG